TFEYTLIHGVNDFENNALALAKLLKGMLCHVNLIPVNSVEGTGFSAGSAESIERFRGIIEKNGISATVRREMGSDISAACGQLRSSIK
ncbi:MAG: 23S rRNA (adenine(2503)-C(2))-methyltransferase RlmN, partial [Clostridiales bacterium]|nr:23S rRNA (adenine(2503)-C(2))-methyltransferase RlmN [Clostridiales bacterium]